MGSKTDKIKGRIKEAVGVLIENDNLQKEGQQDQEVGAVKETAARAADKVQETAAKAAVKVQETAAKAAVKVQDQVTRAVARAKDA